jgi:ferric-dicitrate binding protein FerR (iron transport regulator)
MKAGRKIFAVLLLTAYWTSCRNGSEVKKTTGADGEIIYRSGAGRRTVVSLPDGTEMLMDSFSVVRLPAGFNRLNRDIFLEGSAWFTVHSSGTKPVVVHTRALLTTVLDSGTAVFRIEGYPKSPGEEADLLKGRLSITKSYHSGTDNETAILGPGEMVMINTDIDLMEKEKMDSTELMKLRAAGYP